mgnify:CR=1 FL=1
MSVYKEGYHALEYISNQEKQIWPDACDIGSPAKEGDTLWKYAKQLCDWYGIKSTREVSVINSANKTVKVVVSLMDEWSVSDGIKTAKQATQYFEVSYYKAPNIPGGYDGFFAIEEITNPTFIKKLQIAEEAQYA